MEDPTDDTHTDDATSHEDSDEPDDAHNLLAAMSGTDKGRLPCFAHFKSKQLKLDSGEIIEVSDKKGCERGTACQYSHDIRDNEIIQKFANAITKRVIKTGR